MDISAVDTPQSPTAILLDLDDPAQFGLAMIVKLKDRPRTAILAMWAKTEPSAKITALDLGADDYVTKPLALDELCAHLRAALRHAAWKEQVTTVVAAGNIEINPGNRQVRKAGDVCILRAKNMMCSPHLPTVRAEY